MRCSQWPLHFAWIQLRRNPIAVCYIGKYHHCTARMPSCRKQSVKILNKLPEWLIRGTHIKAHSLTFSAHVLLPFIILSSAIRIDTVCAIKVPDASHRGTYPPNATVIHTKPPHHCLVLFSSARRAVSIGICRKKQKKEFPPRPIKLSFLINNTSSTPPLRRANLKVLFVSVTCNTSLFNKISLRRVNSAFWSLITVIW